MLKLKFSNNKRAIRKLSKVQNSIDKFVKKYPKEFTKRQHRKFRKLLNKRAKALSGATGMKIHSIFD